MDSDNNTCSYYKENDYCKRSGDHKGSAWEKEWGELKDIIDTKNQSALVCPECGCKEGNIYDKIQLDFIFIVNRKILSVCDKSIFIFHRFDRG